MVKQIGPKVVIWEPLSALSMCYIGTWTLWACLVGSRAVRAAASRVFIKGHPEP